MYLWLTILREELDIKPVVLNFCLPLLPVKVITQTPSVCSVTLLFIVVYSISTVAPPSAPANQSL